MSAWELGWRAALREWLRRHPEGANLPPPGEQATPLHLAVLRDEPELVRLLLAHGADVTVADPQFHSTPLGWARHLRRAALVPLLEAAERGQRPN